MNKKENLEAVVWDRPATVSKVRPYVTYLYLEPAGSALTNDALYTENANFERCFMYELQGEKLPRAFESLPPSAAAALRIMKPEPPARPVVERDGQRQVVESRSHPESLVSLIMKKRDAFSGKPIFVPR